MDSTPPDSKRQTLRYSYYVLGVLVVVYLFNFVDRTIIAILLDPIKGDLHVSDTAMGILTGGAFSLMYAIAAVPIGRLADRRSRRNILTTAIASWSVFCASAAFAITYPQLLLSRLGVGLGEAGGTVPSHSLISDYFPPERRSRAFSIYSVGIYLGIATSLFLGGILERKFGWRTAFLAVGLPGLLVALLVRFTVSEPRRGQFDRVVRDEKFTLSQALSFLRHQRGYVYAALGQTSLAAGQGASLAWTPTFLGRVHGMAVEQQGAMLGMLQVSCGIAGTLTGGYLADRLAQRSPAWQMRLPGLCVFAAVPFGIAFLWVDPARLMFAGYGISTLLLASSLGPTFATAQNLVVPRLRAFAAAVLMLATTMGGDAGGPVIAGFLNDLLAPIEHAAAVRTSLTVTLLFFVMAALLFLAASRNIEADIRRRDGHWRN